MLSHSDCKGDLPKRYYMAWQVLPEGRLLVEHRELLLSGLHIVSVTTSSGD